MSKAARVLLLSLMGLTLVWSPLYGTSEALVYPSLAAFAEHLMPDRLVELAAFACACGFLIVRKRIPALNGPLVKNPLAGAGIATGVYCCGIILTALCGHGLGGAWMLYVGSALRGLSFFTTSASWMLLVARQERGIGIPAMFLALAVYAVFGAGVMLLGQVSPALSSLIIVCGPWIGFAGYAAVLRATPEPDFEDASFAPPIAKSTRYMLYFANFVFGFLYGGILFWFNTMTSFGSLAVFFCTAAGMALFAWLRPSTSMNRLLRASALIGLVLTVVFVLLEHVFPQSPTLLCSGLLVMIIFFSFAIFTDSEIATAANDWGMVGMCMVLAAAGIVISLASFNALGIEQLSPDAVLVIAGAGLGFIALVFLPTAAHKRSSWGFSALSPTESQEVIRLRNCDKLAAKHNLTARELEVLQLLTVGKDRDDIAEALYISPHTAKTHIRNVYAKMDVHSAKELQDLALREW